MLYFSNLYIWKKFVWGYILVDFALFACTICCKFGWSSVFSYKSISIWSFDYSAIFASALLSA